MKLYYDHPAENWHESLPLGNGRIGAMVYGGTKKEILALNEDTLWSGYPEKTQKKLPEGYLEKVRELTEKREYQKAMEYLEECFSSSEVNENIKAYGVATHRHTPEIEEQLGYASGEKVVLNFTPHLVPMNRGILATEYATLKKKVTYEEVKAVYDQYYAKEKFVRVLDRDVCPETKWVEGSNYVDIGFKIDPRTNRIIMMGAIDNLVKGAAGQAVQNMNLLFGLPEDEGLELVPMFP